MPLKPKALHSGRSHPAPPVSPFWALLSRPVGREFRGSDGHISSRDDLWVFERLLWAGRGLGDPSAGSSVDLGHEGGSGEG